MMVVTEVVKASDREHTGYQGLALLSEMARTPRQPGQTLPEGGIEPFDVSGVDDPAARGLFQQPGDHAFTPLHDAALDAQLPGGALLDDLHDSDVGPGDQAGTAAFFSLKGGPKGAPEGLDIAGQPVHRQQQVAAQRNLADLVGQFLDQIQVALGTNGPAQP